MSGEDINRQGMNERKGRYRCRWRVDGGGGQMRLEEGMYDR